MRTSVDLQPEQNPRRNVGAWLRAQCQGLPLQRLDLGVQRGDALTLPHMLIEFEDIPDEKIPKDMLELASHIVETKSGRFEPEKFEDQYEDALKELLKKKQAGGEDRST